MMPNESQNSFLQTDAWEEFNEAIGYTTWRLPAGRQVLAIKVTARRGAFLLVPHVNFFSPELSEKLVQLAQSEHCAWIRVCPLMADTPEHRTIFTKLGFRDAPTQPHPKLSWILDIRQSEDELLKAMRKTTRYSIRKAENEVEVVMSDRPEDVETFWDLHLATVQRHHFTPFSKEYIKKEFEVFAKYDATRWFFGKVKNDITSSAMIIYANGSAFYHHGASKAEHPTASYLVQWRAIQEAKRRGCYSYNFWGIAPDDQPNHPWAGVTKFKKGFGGHEEAYVAAQDLVLAPRYWVSYLLETFRRKKRNL